MGKRILGLDLGTNSIGWAVVDDLGNGNFKVVQRVNGFKLRGVHIFQEAVNKDSKGSESSKAAQRTGFRSARKIKYRRKLRKIETLKVLSNFGFCPKLQVSELNAWRYERTYPMNPDFLEWQRTGSKEDSSRERNPYYLRWLAATTTLNLDEEEDRFKLGRVFYHMAQRRGFKSNRKDGASEDAKEDLRDQMLELLEEEFSSIAELSSSIELLAEGIEDKKLLSFIKSTVKSMNRQPDFNAAHRFLYDHLNKRENLGKVKGEIARLTSEMQEKGFQTLGQLFWKEYYEKGKRIRGQHTARDEHYLAEFDYICLKQGISEERRKKLYDAIFYQRPLKSQKGLVAKCPFEQKKKRAPVSHPFFEEFRMWQTLNNIKVQMTGDRRSRPLTHEEKGKAIPLFFRAKQQFDFSDIAEALANMQEYGCVNDKDCDASIQFNYRADQTVSGCPLTARLMRLFAVKDYRELAQVVFDAYKGSKVEKKGRERLPSEILTEIWHVLFSFTDSKQIRKYAVEKLGLDDAKAVQFAKIKPKQDYGSLSMLAIRRILPYLRKGYLYSHAVFLSNIDYVIADNIENHPGLEEEIKLLIDGHSIYQYSVKIANSLQERCRKNPDQVENVYYWATKGWERWCDEVRSIFIREEGQAKWDCLYDSEREGLFRQSREIFNKLKETTEPLKASTIEERIKEQLMEWAVQHGKTAIVTERLDKLYHPSKEELYVSKTVDGVKYLDSPVISSIRNPVFNRALHRLKAVVNELIRTGEINQDTVIHLEVANEMNDANRRAALRFWQEDLRKMREADKKSLSELFPEREISDADALRYKLRREQGNVCLYCGEEIGVSNLLSSDYQIEHTIPRSRCCDNSQENKTLAHLACNQRKGRRIPYECENYADIIPRLNHWKVEIDELDRQIEGKKRAAKSAGDKPAKDKIIRARLGLQFKRDYLWGKYRRFLMEDAPEGFKNSQLVDTRIITKYARSYLKSVFNIVHTVNGKITDDFRHYWGIQDSFEKKDRSNHVHHAVDAAVVACITRGKYQQLAEAYQADEEKHSHIHVEKPWSSFVQDMARFQDEILVSHYAPNNLLKQTNRKTKVKGKTVVQKSKTARGSLHQDTFYGAIKRMEKQRNGDVVEATKYVSRKPLESLDDKQLNNIVDDRIREIVIAGRLKANEFKKEMEALKKKRFTVDADEETVLKQRIEELQSQLEHLYVLPNKNGEPVPIKKVRVYSNLNNPIELKKHRDKSSKTECQHKETIYVNNEGNYLMAVYEGVDSLGRSVRDYKIINNHASANGIVPDAEMDGLKLIQIVRNGQMVLLYRESADELEQFSSAKLGDRLYIVRGIDDDGIKLYFHQEARMTTEVIAFMNEIITDENQRNGICDKNGQIKQSKLTTPKGGDVIDRCSDFPYVKFRPSNFNALIEGVDFRLNSIGEIEFMEL